MNSVIVSDAIAFMYNIKSRPHLILTDPPYGMAYKTNIPGDKRWNKTGKTQQFDILKNDTSLDDIDFDVFFKLCYEKSAEDSCLFLFCKDRALVEWSISAVHAGYIWKDTLIWDKRCANGGDINWPFIDVTEFLIALIKGKPKFHKLLNASGQFRKRVVNIFHVGRTPKKEYCGHPTQKPLFLCEQIIRATTNIGDYVVDPFCGSGTSLIAANRLNRTYDGCDIDSRFVDISMRRLDMQKYHLHDDLDFVSFFNDFSKKDQQMHIFTKRLIKILGAKSLNSSDEKGDIDLFGENFEIKSTYKDKPNGKQIRLYQNCNYLFVCKRDNLLELYCLSRDEMIKEFEEYLPIIFCHGITPKNCSITNVIKDKREISLSLSKKCHLRRWIKNYFVDVSAIISKAPGTVVDIEREEIYSKIMSRLNKERLSSDIINKKLQDNNCEIIDLFGETG